MCLGLAAGFIKSNKIRDGDIFYLDTKDDVFEYIAKATPNGFVLVALDDEAPVEVVHESRMKKYNFHKI